MVALVKKRVTAALVRIFGKISDIHGNCCCTAGAVAPRAREATSDTHKQQWQTQNFDSFSFFSIFCFQFQAMKHPRLNNAFSTNKPDIFPEGPPPSSIDLNSSCSCCETRVDLANHRIPIQLPSRVQGAMHPASTLSFELADLVVSVGGTPLACTLKSLLFAEN